jgi:hypothetical protein
MRSLIRGVEGLALSVRHYHTSWEAPRMGVNEKYWNCRTAGKIWDDIEEVAFDLENQFAYSSMGLCNRAIF